MLEQRQSNYKPYMTSGLSVQGFGTGFDSRKAARLGPWVFG